MVKFKFLGLALSVIFLSAFTLSGTMSWNIDEGHSIEFSTKKVKGHFENFSGDIQFDENNLAASKVAVELEVNSIKTGNFMKNQHARNKSWFNAKEFPTIKFTSTNFSSTGSSYAVTGILEIRGIEKEITMPFTFTDNTFRSNFTVNRTDFNVGKTTGMAKSVGHEISLNLEVPVSK